MPNIKRRMRDGNGSPITGAGAGGTLYFGAHQSILFKERCLNSNVIKQ